MILANQAYGDSLLSDILSAIQDDTTLVLRGRNLTAVNTTILTQVDGIYGNINGRGLGIDLSRNLLDQSAMLDILTAFQLNGWADREKIDFSGIGNANIDNLPSTVTFRVPTPIPSNGQVFNWTLGADFIIQFNGAVTLANSTKGADDVNDAGIIIGVSGSPTAVQIAAKIAALCVFSTLQISATASTDTVTVSWPNKTKVSNPTVGSNTAGCTVLSQFNDPLVAKIYSLAPVTVNIAGQPYTFLPQA